MIVAESGFGAGRYQMFSTVSLDIPAQNEWIVYRDADDLDLRRALTGDGARTLRHSRGI